MSGPAKAQTPKLRALGPIHLTLSRHGPIHNYCQYLRSLPREFRCDPPRRERMAPTRLRLQSSVVRRPSFVSFNRREGYDDRTHRTLPSLSFRRAADAPDRLFFSSSAFSVSKLRLGHFLLARVRLHGFLDLRFHGIEVEARALLHGRIFDG